ncbi:MAG TPA: hypothetical protein VMN83_27430 [Albitalea sp.]|nr:hypothetical protein [Albitalea sp.]
MAHAHKGLQQARAAGDLNTEAAIHTNIGVTSIEANRAGLALAHYQHALDAYQAAGSRSGVINVRSNLAQVEMTLGRLANARDLLQRVVQECREIGSRRLEAMACANLGGMLSELGEAQSGYDTAVEGVRLSRLSGESRTEAWAHHSAQTAAGVLGRFHDALDHARAACAGFKAHKDQTAEWINAGAAVRNLQALGRQDEALAAADTLLAEVDARGGWDGGFEPAYHVYRALAPLGDPRAQDLLACAYAAFSAEADLLAEHVPRDTFMHSTFVARGICEDWAAAQAAGNAKPG